jgi:HAD superfamily hydrolase (TIGR01509 family)
MGGDQLVGALTDDGVEGRLGEQIRSEESDFYKEMIGEVEAMDGSRELLGELHAGSHRVILASSAKEWEVEHYVDLLDARELADAWTSSGDVDATKPKPDLVEVALERGGARPDDAVMIGDSPWDIEAAERAGVRTLAVMTGGFAREELLEAGAVEVYESVAELRAGLGETMLASSA